jgi:tRNA (adenine57-N1/adenine58-N1)-methyltransferase catalytic subunit
MRDTEVMKENDLSVVVYRDKKYLKRLEVDKSFHGKGGILPFSMVVGCPWGTRFGEYEVFRPTIEDVMMYGVRRETQIIFPKDAFYVSSKLDIRPGSRVLEIGTGSGTLTLLLSRTVGPDGLVVTVEKEERHYKNAKKNIEKYSEYPNIEFHNMDIGEFEGETSPGNGPFDAAFVDLREPWVYMDRIRSLLRGSAVTGFIVPTANQVSETLQALRQGFGDVEVIEILFRTYKTLAARLRPEDRMVGHTGYLLFARKLEMITELNPSTSGQPEQPSEEGEVTAETGPAADTE